MASFLGTLKAATRNLGARVLLPGARRSYLALHEQLRAGNTEPTLEHVVSQLATQRQIDSDLYRDWVARLKLPAIRHRKYWEFAFIMEALRQAGLLSKGQRGLGFGVGKEPLAAMMVSLGCRVVASDADPVAAIAAGWGTNDEHASGLASLNERGICSDEELRANTEFRVIDMNALPDDARGFDFCWSSCAFEHLGSIDHGLRFVEASLDCVKPGGLAVHTTEFNLSSDTETVMDGATVLYRHSDIERLAKRLRSAGHQLELNYHPGQGELDHYIDLPPYQLDPHLKLMIGKYVTTSIGLIVKKAD